MGLPQSIQNRDPASFSRPQNAQEAMGREYRPRAREGQTRPKAGNRLVGWLASSLVGPPAVASNSRSTLQGTSEECHPERSEGSRFLAEQEILRALRALRMTFFRAFLAD